MIRNTESESKYALLPYTIIYSIVVVSGIVGNSFVVSMYLVKMRRKEMETRYFIPILAVFDLLMCVLAGIFVIENYVPVIGIFFSDGRCKALYFFLAFAMMTSNALLLTIAIQRYLKVCRPLGKQMNLFSRRLTTVVVITTSIIYALPTLIVTGVTSSYDVEYGMNISVNISSPSCGPANQEYPMFQLVYYTVLFVIGASNLLVTIGMYTPIMFAIYRHFHKRNAHLKPKDDDYKMAIQGKEQKDMRVTLQDQEGKNDLQNKKNSGAYKKTRIPTTNFNMMFFFIILIYIVAYVPTMVIVILLSQVKIVYFGLFRFLSGFYVINHAANPFVYAYFDMQMRQKVTSLCSRNNR